MQKSDIPALAKTFPGGRYLKQDRMDELLARNWPGNVRELKKYCERLKIENGEKIFNKTNSETSFDFPAFDFDYERYRKEFETWDKYIQPIIHKHRIDRIKYEYQPWDDNWVNEKSKDKNPEKRFWAMLLAHNIWDDPNHPQRDDENYTHGSVKLLKWLREGIDKEAALSFNMPDEDIDIFDEKIIPQKILPKFRHHLRKHIRTKTLPYFLKLIAKQDETIKRSDSLTKPPLSYLLDLPEKEAIYNFKKIFLSYQLKKGSNSNLKLTPKSLKQKIKRLKRRINK